MRLKLIAIILFSSLSIFAQNRDGTRQKSIRLNSVNTSVKDAIEIFSNEHNLTKHYTYKTIYKNIDKGNLSHEKFQQYYKNLKIEFGTIITHSNDQGVYLINGELYNTNEVDVIPTLSSDEALQEAINELNATVYLWEDKEQSLIMDYKKPVGELLLFPDVYSNKVHLAYKFDIYSLIPHKREEVYVDAKTGNLLFKNPIIKHTNNDITHNQNLNYTSTENKVNNTFITASAATRYSGIKQIETTLLGSDYILHDNTRGNGIQTFNCENGSIQNVNFTDADNVWSAAEYDNAQKDNAALDAHWGAEKTYDFWNVYFNRNSFDGNGGTIKSYVHFSTNYVNASWNGSFMIYGDGSASIQPLTSIDICAHEIGHAICTYTAGLVYQNESGALNEGFSDIWGACVEQYGKNGTLSGTISPSVWLIAEEIGASPFRSMSDPNSKGDPDTYLGTNWYSGAGDNGGVHTNSGVLNHWFYILTEGKSGTNNAPTPDTYNVTGIGMQKAAEIAYIAERDYLTPNSTYADARVATIEAASSIYCANSPEVIAVTNAWYAVNVGDQYTSVSDDIALQTITGTNTISCGATLNPVLNLKNQGLNPISTISISYSIDGGVATNLNWTGNLNPCSSTTFPLTLTGLSRGKHILEVTSTIVNDGKPENNTKSITLLVNDSGTFGVVNPFTNSSDELITYDFSGTTTTWKRGIRSSGNLSSNGNTVYTTNLTGNYANNKKSYIVSQCYDLTNTSNPQISFAMKFDLEQDWDIVYVEYTTDFGLSWSVLGQMGANWYNSDRTPQTAGNDCNNCVGAQWTGTDFNLNTYSYPLTSLVGQSNVIFRIVFHSDQALNQLGVNIDDFVINGVLSNESFNQSSISIYPNPSKGIYNVSFSDQIPTSIEVFDLTGKIIVTKDPIYTTNNNEVSLDLSTVAQGIYFVKILVDDKQVVKRIIKE